MCAVWSRDFWFENQARPHRVFTVTSFTVHFFSLLSFILVSHAAFKLLYIYVKSFRTYLIKSMELYDMHVCVCCLSSSSLLMFVSASKIHRHREESTLLWQALQYTWCTCTVQILPKSKVFYAPATYKYMHEPNHCPTVISIDIHTDGLLKSLSVNVSVSLCLSVCLCMCMCMYVGEVD